MQRKRPRRPCVFSDISTFSQVFLQIFSQVLGTDCKNATSKKEKAFVAKRPVQDALPPRRMGVAPPRSTRSRSGYKYVIYDGRSKARSKPWSVNYKGYRSAGFESPLKAAKHLSTKLEAAGFESSLKAAKHLSTKRKAITSPSPPAKRPTGPPNDWMISTKLHFDKSSCDLFGRRLMIDRRLAVIKAWTPCAAAAFGIVFDDQPDKVFMEDLFRRSGWKLVDWEDDDIWETQDLRPMCPQCGHPLGVGSAAWTLCIPCGHMEPGAASTQMLSRLRSGDPFRRGTM